MNRLSKHSALLALAALVILGVWLYFDMKSPMREPGQNPTVADIVGIRPDDVTRVDVVREGKTISLARAGTAWKIEQPFKADADAEAVKQALEGLLDLATDYLMEDVPADLDRYGLKQPERTATLVTKDKSVALQFGSPDPGKSAVFTRAASTGRVFLVGSYAVDALAGKAADDFRDKTMLAIPTASIERIRLVRSSGSVTLVRSGEKWSVTEPLAVPADAFAVDGLADTLSSLKADKFAEAGASDLKPYGLDTPHLAVEVAARGGAQYGVNLGKETPGGTARYAVRAGGTDVVEIPLATANALDKAVTELRSKKMVDCATESVERLSVTSRKGAWEVVKSGTEWQFVKPNAGAKADALDVDNVLLDITGSADRWVADNPSGSDLTRFGLVSPETSAVLTLKGGAKKRLEIGRKAPGGDYHARGTDTGSSVFTSPSYVLERLQTPPKTAK